MSTESVFTQLTTIQSWPDAALALSVVVITGYCFRFWKSFPNGGIPAVVILTGAAAFMVLAPEHPEAMPHRVWHARNCCVGLTIGFIGWLAHNLIVRHIEDWLAAKFESVNSLLNKPKP